MSGGWRASTGVAQVGLLVRAEAAGRCAGREGLTACRPINRSAVLGRATPAAHGRHALGAPGSCESQKRPWSYPHNERSSIVASSSRHLGRHLIDRETALLHVGDILGSDGVDDEDSQEDVLTCARGAVAARRAGGVE
jgi:hypothetical protein